MSGTDFDALLRRLAGEEAVGESAGLTSTVLHRIIHVAMTREDPVSIDPDIQAGTPCFLGTRVPVRSLFDALKHGRSSDYFLTQVPAVSRPQVEAVLDRARQLVGAGDSAA